MSWMNEYEIEEALARLDHETQAGKLACDLQKFVNWTNANSDGWPYWRKPARAAETAQKQIQQAMRTETDISEHRRLMAMRPIKAFLTRQGADWKEIFRDTARNS